jgi:hypothetical protein
MRHKILNIEETSFALIKNATFPRTTDASSIKTVHRDKSFHEDVYANSVTRKIRSTDFTRELIEQVTVMLESIFKSGYGYRKSGIVLLELQSITGQSRRLFREGQYLQEKAKRLPHRLAFMSYKAVLGPLRSKTAVVSLKTILVSTSHQCPPCTRT